jgi:UDP-glucose 4-epimerase
VRVLVTGGAGFIGSHVVDRLCADGHEPRIFDLVHSPYLNGDVEWAVGDLLDRRALDKAMSGCDAVIHLAAVADVHDVAADPTRAELVNTRGTQVALESACATGVGRFLYASTVWVYGGADGNGRIVDENTPLVVPNHLYTATKLAGEMYCRSYAEMYGLGQVTLRFGIPYGPRSRAAAVVATFVARARAGKSIVVAGDGLQSRQFVYVEDLAEGVVAALRADPPPAVYNLVGKDAITIREVAEQVRDLVADVPIVHVDGRKADAQLGRVSAELAARKLGWSASTPFRQGIRVYLDWVTATSGSPRVSTDSTIAGNASTVRRQEPGAP